MGRFIKSIVNRMTKTKEKILITGGSGFIGTNLMEYYLSIGATVLNIDIKSPKKADHLQYWKRVDILDLDKLKSTVSNFKPDFIIHLAARANLTGSNLSDYAVNIEGVENIIKIGNDMDHVKKIIFASTMLVCKAGYIPKCDNDYCPPNLYGESKSIGEKIVRQKAAKFNWAIVRPSSIWGPWFGPTYKRFFEMIITKKYFNFTGKMSTKTYGYIGNIVYQIDSILHNKKSNDRTFYLGDYKPTNIRNWSKEIGKELNLRVPTIPRSLVFLLAKAGDILKYLNINFPLNSFRFKNMTTDNVLPLDSTYEIAPETKFSRMEGNKITLNWLREQNK